MAEINALKTLVPPQKATSPYGDLFYQPLGKDTFTVGTAPKSKLHMGKRFMVVSGAVNRFNGKWVISNLHVEAHILDDRQPLPPTYPEKIREVIQDLINQLSVSDQFNRICLYAEEIRLHNLESVAIDNFEKAHAKLQDLKVKMHEAHDEYLSFVTDPATVKGLEKKAA